MDIGGLGYKCTGDEVTCSGHVTSSNVTNILLAIILERKDIQRRGWPHCVCLVKTVLVTCNMTYFTGHRVTLTLRQIFILISLGKKMHISIRLDKRNTVVLLEIRYPYLLFQKLFGKKQSLQKCHLFSLTWPKGIGVGGGGARGGWAPPAGVHGDEHP